MILNPIDNRPVIDGLCAKHSAATLGTAFPWNATAHADREENSIGLTYGTNEAIIVS